MAITKLRTDFKDDIINTEINDKRRYNLENNSDGTISLEDVTTYVQTGDYYGEAEINALNGTVNEVIDAVETSQENIASVSGSVSEVIQNIENGSIVAKNAESATDAENATSATSAEQLKTARNINGIAFDGTEDITVYDDTKLSLDSDFILLNQGALSFTNKSMTISDSRITENSLADVYFTSDTIAYAEEAGISVETISGAVILTAINAPTSTIKATIHIRVVEA